MVQINHLVFGRWFWRWGRHVWASGDLTSCRAAARYVTAQPKTTLSASASGRVDLTGLEARNWTLHLEPVPLVIVP